MALEALMQAARVLRHQIRRILKRPMRLRSQDRRVLEEIILPAYASRNDIQRILSVGVEVYTTHYPELMPGREFHTMDSDRRLSMYGAPIHIVDRVENLADHYGPNSLDLILMNGLIGWGLNTVTDFEKALVACLGCLRHGGELLLGWDDSPEYQPFVPESVAALHNYEPVIFPAVGLQRYQTQSELRHIFAFYRKPQATNSHTT